VSASSLIAWCVRGGAQQKQGKKQKGKAKAKDGGGGAGGGPSNKASAAGSSSGEASSSRGQGSRPSTLPPAGADHRSTVEDAVPPALPSATSDTQQPAGGGKKEMERQRKERQRKRRMDEAKEALQVAIEAMLDARCGIPIVVDVRRQIPFRLHGSR
jgi:hypothetical protein